MRRGIHTQTNRICWTQLLQQRICNDVVATGGIKILLYMLEYLVRGQTRFFSSRTPPKAFGTMYAPRMCSYVYIHARELLCQSHLAKRKSCKPEKYLLFTGRLTSRVRAVQKHWAHNERIVNGWKKKTLFIAHALGVIHYIIIFILYIRIIRFGTCIITLRLYCTIYHYEECIFVARRMHRGRTCVMYAWVRAYNMSVDDYLNRYTRESAARLKRIHKQ